MYALMLGKYTKAKSADLQRKTQSPKLGNVHFGDHVANLDVKQRASPVPLRCV